MFFLSVLSRSTDFGIRAAEKVRSMKAPSRTIAAGVHGRHWPRTQTSCENGCLREGAQPRARTVHRFVSSFYVPMPFQPLIRLVDDDADLRGALLFALRMAGFDAAGYESAEDFLSHDDCRRPGCVVMDIRMGGMTGLECQAKMPDAGFDQPIIFLSGHGDVEMALLAVKRGAADFLTKPVRVEKLAESCRRLCAWHESERKAAAEKRLARERVESLTPRELDVAREAAKGLPNKAIANALGVSEQAVKIHRSSIYKKLDAKSAVDIKACLDEAGVENAAAKAAADDAPLIRTALLPPDPDEAGR